MSIIRGTLSSDGFTMVPNHWLRDPELSYKGKGILSAIASHDPAYPLTIEQLIAQSRDGKDAVLSGIREIEKVGYLRRSEQHRGADGKMGGYDYVVIEFPHGVPDAGNVSAGQHRRGKSSAAPGRKTRPGADQAKQGVSAGRDRGGFPGAVNPPLRRPGVEDQGENHPPYPPEPEPDLPADLPTEPGGGGGEDQEDPTTPGLDAVVAAVLEHQPGWKPAGVRAVLRQAVADGRSPSVAAAALTRLAAGDYGPTSSPGRLNADGPWWAVRPEPKRERFGPRCTRPGHVGQPADHCVPCRSEQAERRAPGARPQVTAEQHQVASDDTRRAAAQRARDLMAANRAATLRRSGMHAVSDAG